MLVARETIEPDACSATWHDPARRERLRDDFDTRCANGHVVLHEVRVRKVLTATRVFSIDVPFANRPE